MENEIVILKKAMATPLHGDGRSKLRVPEPQSFDESRDAKALQNFLWNMDQYFLKARVPKDKKVSITALCILPVMPSNGGAQECKMT